MTRQVLNSTQTKDVVDEEVRKKILSYQAIFERNPETGTVERAKELSALNMDPRAFGLFLIDAFLTHRPNSWNLTSYEFQSEWKDPSCFIYQTTLTEDPQVSLKCPLCFQPMTLQISWKGEGLDTVRLSGLVKHIRHHFVVPDDRRRWAGRYNQFCRALHWKPRTREAIHADRIKFIQERDRSDPSGSRFEELTRLLEILDHEATGDVVEPDHLYFVTATPVLGLHGVAGTITQYFGAVPEPIHVPLSPSDVLNDDDGSP